MRFASNQMSFFVCAHYFECMCVWNEPKRMISRGVVIFNVNFARITISIGNFMYFVSEWRKWIFENRVRSGTLLCKDQVLAPVIFVWRLWQKYWHTETKIRNRNHFDSSRACKIPESVYIRSDEVRSMAQENQKSKNARDREKKRRSNKWCQCLCVMWWRTFNLETHQQMKLSVRSKHRKPINHQVWQRQHA